MDLTLNATETEKTQMDSETEVTTAIATETEDVHSEEAKTIIAKKICGVCNNQEPKYKCTRCALPFCSVACSKIHKTTHPPEEPRPAPITKTEPVPSNGSDPRPGTIAAAGSRNPFAALDNSLKLRELFKLYPRLPALLEEINKTTLPPTATTQGGEFGGARRWKEQPWNLDLGLQRGVTALSKARNSNDKDGESLREYSNLVLQILSKDVESVEEIIRKELATENAKFIENLLKAES